MDCCVAHRPEGISARPEEDFLEFATSPARISAGRSVFTARRAVLIGAAFASVEIFRLSGADVPAIARGDGET